MEPSHTVITVLVRNAELNLCQTFSFADFATKAGQKMSLEERGPCFQGEKYLILMG